MNFNSTKSNQLHPRKAPASRRMFMIRKRSFRISEKRFRGSGWALRGRHRPAEESKVMTRPDAPTTSKYQVRFMSRISPGRTHPDKSRGLSLSLRACFQPLLLGFAVHECANFQYQLPWGEGQDDRLLRSERGGGSYAGRSSRLAKTAGVFARAGRVE